MSKIQGHKVLFWTIIAISFIFENLCFGAEQIEQKTIAMLDKQVIQLEETWKAGKTNEYFLKAREIAKIINPHMNITYTEEQYEEANKLRKAGKTNEYYAKIEDFDKEILSHSITGNLNKIAAKLFDNIISKKANIIDVGNNDLYALENLRSYLTSNDKVSIEERRINALLLSRYLGEIRKELIPNFEPKRVVSNVAPPHDARGGFMFSGMDPKAITNPVVRTQYEAAINENRQNGIMNRRQSELRSMGDELSTKRIMDYIIKTFRGDDTSTALLAECIKAANLTDKEKEEVLRKVGVKQPKQGKVTGIDQNPIKNR